MLAINGGTAAFEFDPSRFENVDTIDEAMHLILLPAEGLSSAERWRIEAPYLLKLMAPYLHLESRVLDYGCGIGRLAKPMIIGVGCEVIGVDISARMRAFAASCVNDSRFFALPPEMLPLLRDGICHFAVAVWTLQHCIAPRLEVHRIKDKLTDGGKLFVVNDAIRSVPISDGSWADDGIDIRAILREFLTEIEFGWLGENILPGVVTKHFWAIYQKLIGDPKVFLFGTCYVDSDARAILTRQWADLMLRLNADCEIWLIDSASPMMPALDPRIRIFNFGDNIGHLSRANVTRGLDGWGRAFCKGLELAKGFDYAVHIEADSLFRYAVMPICRDMRRRQIKVASIPVQSGFRGVLKDWVETGLMFWDCRYIAASNFIARYDWPNRTRLPTPEVVVRKLVGNDLTMMPWKGLRQDKIKTVSRYNIAGAGLDWITHFHDDGMAYDKFIETVAG